MPLTGTTIDRALEAVGAKGKQIRSAGDLAAGANAALAKAPAGLTVAGAAAFMATMAQESAYFRTTTEYGTGHRYAPYIGRTFEQITWKANYAAFGKWCHRKGLLSDPAHFVTNPKALSEYRWAWLGGVWYFEHAGLWKYANRGDFRAVSQGVNGGVGRIGTSFTPHGMRARQAMFEAFRSAGTALLPGDMPKPPKPKPTPLPTPRVLRVGSVGGDVKRLQDALNRVFPTYSRLAEDGSYGPAVKKVIAEFQRRAKADGKYKDAVDGIVGPNTRTALRGYGVTF